MKVQHPVWSSQTKLVVSVLVLALLVYLVYRFSAVIPPLILAVILSYVLSPFTTRIQNHLSLSRGWATLLTYIILVILIVATLMLILPPLAAQLNILNLDVQILLQQAEILLGHQFSIFGQVIDGSLVLEQISESFRNLLEPFIGQTLVFVVDVITSVIWLIFILVVSFYLIKDGPSLRKWLETLPPPDYRQDYINLRDKINTIWGGFFRGQLVLALVVATIFTLIGFIIGLPFALA